MIDFLTSVASREGWPREIVSDNGTHFTSSLWRANAFHLVACSLPLAARFLCSVRDVSDAAAAIAAGQRERERALDRRGERCDRYVVGVIKICSNRGVC